MRRALFVISLFLIACLCLARAQDMSLTGVGGSISNPSGNNFTPTVILNQFNSSIASGSHTSNSSADIPVNSLVCVLIGAQTGGSSETVSSVADSGGLNTYSKYGQETAPTASFFSIELWCSVTTHDLPSGSNWTVTMTSGHSYSPIVIKSTANGGLDQKAGASNAGTSVSVSTSTLAQANELIIAATYPSGSFGGFTEGSGFTGLVSNTGANAVDLSYKNTSSTTAVTYNPSWVSSVSVTALISAIK